MEDLVRLSAARWLMPLLALAGAERGAWYFAGLGLAALIAAGLQWRARSRRRADCFRAFELSHWLGFAVFLGLVLDYR